MQEFVYRVEERPLPEVLTDLREFRDLNVEQAQSVLTRIRLIQEFCLKLQDVHQEDPDDLRFAIGDLELDAAICLSVSGDPEARVSPWLIHTSWTFNTNAKELSGCLSSEARNLLAAPLPGATCSREGFVIWIDSYRGLLNTILDDFFGATTLAQCLASYIAMNLIIAKLLAGFVEARFNDRL